jgi:SlyX protein
MSAHSHDQRLDALELKFMDLENTVQELHEVVLKQYQDLDRLAGQLNRLTDRIDNSAPDAQAPAASDELPPHY